MPSHPDYPKFMSTQDEEPGRSPGSTSIVQRHRNRAHGQRKADRTIARINRSGERRLIDLGFTVYVWAGRDETRRLRTSYEAALNGS
ncbi:hypothetical protein SAMN05444166_3311 [Singulisphaera sp. GP187]|nr:hypothetical protein SAMN05444166_3311 [Singulisphaera sp. GP187]